MKKVLAMVLALMMVLAMTACNGGGADKTTEAGGIDMSKYPAKLNEWSGQNFLDYFKEAGVFTNEEWTYVQDHATYWAGTAVDECAGYMDMDGLVMICVFIVDEDSTEADAKAFMDHVRTNKMFPEDLSSIPVDHMVENVIFWYSATVDEAVYNAMDAAYNNLIQAMGVTPDF